MARIEEKRKEKLSSVIWTWVVAGILGAVVIAGLVLGIIYLVESSKEDEETTFEEQYPDAKLISYEDLNQILEQGERSELHVDGTIYVLVYSPDYETYENGEKISSYVNDVIKTCDENGVNGVNAFYVVNVTSEDNKDSVITDYSNLSSLSTEYPYLLVLKAEDGYQIGEDSVITQYKDINNTLHFAFVEGSQE